MNSAAESKAKALEAYHFLTMGSDTLENPYPFFQRLRAEQPVFREPDLGVYLISKYDDIQFAESHSEIFSAIAQVTGPFLPLPCAVDQLEAYRALPEGDKLFTNDPPSHTRYRAIIGPLFAPKRLAALESSVRRHAAELFDSFSGSGRVEFVRQVANVLPLLVIGDLLGVSAEDNARMKKLFEAQFERMEEGFVGGPNGDPTASAAGTPIVAEYFAREISRRRTHSENDLMSSLAAATFSDGEPVPLDVILALCIFFYGAGGEANTPQLMTNGARILAENPQLADRLRASPELIESFVEETLRFETSALGLFRAVRQDTELGGVAIPKGALVMLLYGSGNHDEAHFEAPEEFRLDRPKRRVLSFGYGPHTCPGAPLARLEARIVFEELLTRFENLRISEEQKEFQFLPSCILRSVRRLDLAFDQRVSAR